MDIQFSIDDCLPFGFDTGGAVPQQSSSEPVPVSAVLVAPSVGESIVGHAEMEEL